MAIISSFLCWSNTRTGSAVCGYYTLVISVLCLAFYMLRYIALDEMDSIELKGIVYAGFVLYSFLIGVSLILLPGVYMDRKFFLLPWIYVLVITVLYETGAIALITTVHLEQDHTLNPWEIIAVVFYCVRLVANCYCFACVVSQYQELSEGRGTYEFLFKPRRRHMARGAPFSDIDEYNPPYGVSLPPYSEDNPYKEFSPPNYENLAVDFADYDYDPPSFSHCSWSRTSSLRLQGAASVSCLAEVVVNTPPSGFDDINLEDEQVYEPQHVSELGSQYYHHHHHHSEYPEHEDSYDRHSEEPQQHYHQHHHLQNPPHHCPHHHHHHLRDTENSGGELNNAEPAVDTEDGVGAPYNHHHHPRHHNRSSSYPSHSLTRGSRRKNLADQAPHHQPSSSACGEVDRRCGIHHSRHGSQVTGAVAMTESSGCFLKELSPLPSSLNTASNNNETPSSSPRVVAPSRLWGYRSPPAIQKRTYITWI